ncbi:hypothetical protein DFH06DRAFT_741801 [Mycena polygramma]|nr:hypothetical protein DFH06DRAFT_741801 [Mycena polygramma]
MHLQMILFCLFWRTATSSAKTPSATHGSSSTRPRAHLVVHLFLLWYFPKLEDGSSSFRFRDGPSHWEPTIFWRSHATWWSFPWCCLSLRNKISCIILPQPSGQSLSRSNFC